MADEDQITTEEGFVLELMTLHEWETRPDLRERAMLRLQLWARVNVDTPRTFLFRTSEGVEILRMHYEPAKYRWGERGVSRDSYCDECCATDGLLDAETDLCEKCYGPWRYGTLA